MKDALEAIRARTLGELEQAESALALEEIRVRVLGRKGELTALLRGMRDVPAEERPAVGDLMNRVKSEVEARLDERQGLLSAARLERSLAEERLDVTEPGIRSETGTVHPLMQVMNEVVDVFSAMGFSVADGPEIEDDYHNFEALNFPADHPARDMQDTLFVEAGRLLRTHTSPVQVRVMESRQPPLRVVVPGAVFRHDDDVTHSPMFHQVEGFLVDERVTFGDLKGVLSEFLRRFFGADTRVRFRPSFFPFTEPSAEVDMGCVLCASTGRAEGGSTCRICKGTTWLEILGSGMIDPAVFRFVGYDPEKVSGFAFGLGIERIAMIRHQIGDIRLFRESDLRFLRQF